MQKTHTNISAPLCYCKGAKINLDNIFYGKGDSEKVTLMFVLFILGAEEGIRGITVTSASLTLAVCMVLVPNHGSVTVMMAGVACSAIKVRYCTIILSFSQQIKLK